MTPDNVPTLTGSVALLEGPSVPFGTPNTPKRHGQLRPPWKPGQSGNPGGKPKGARTSPAKALRRLLETRPSDKAVAIIQKRFPEADPKALMDVVAAAHIEDTLYAPNAGERSSARNSLYKQIEAPPQSTAPLSVHLSLSANLGALDDLEAPEPMAALPPPDEKESPPSVETGGGDE